MFCRCTILRRLSEASIKASVDDIRTQVGVSQGKLKLMKVMKVVRPETRSVIAQFGKGLEGFIRSHSQQLQLVASSGGEKHVIATAQLESPSCASTRTEPSLSLLPDPLLTPRLPEPPIVRQFEVRALEKANLEDIMENPTGGTYSFWSLRVRLFSIMDYQVYYSATDLFQALYPERSSANLYTRFESHLESQIKDRHYFSYTEPKTKELWVAKRDFHLGDDVTAFPFVQGSVKVVRAKANRVQTADAGVAGLPTTADLWEILRYIPCEFISIQCLISIPPPKKKLHIRAKSIVHWLSMSPRFFDVRIGVEPNTRAFCRRSPMLNPTEVGMTVDEAAEYVAKRIDADQANPPTEVMTQLRILNVDGTNNKFITVAERQKLKNDNVELLQKRLTHEQIVEARVKLEKRWKQKVYRTEKHCVSATPGVSHEHLEQVLRQSTFREDYFTFLPVVLSSCSLCDGFSMVRTCLPAPGNVAQQAVTTMVQLIQASPELSAQLEVWKHNHSPSSAAIFVRRKGDSVSESLAAFKEEVSGALQKQGEATYLLLLEIIYRVCEEWDQIPFVFIRTSSRSQRVLENPSGLRDFALKFPAVFQVTQWQIRLKKLSTSSSCPLDGSEHLDEEQGSPWTAKFTYSSVGLNPYQNEAEIAKVLRSLCPEQGYVLLQTLRLSPAIYAAIKGVSQELDTPAARLAQLSNHLKNHVGARSEVAVKFAGASDAKIRRTRPGTHTERQAILDFIKKQMGPTGQDTVNIEFQMRKESPQLLEYYRKYYELDGDVMKGTGTKIFCLEHPDHFDVIVQQSKGAHIFKK